MYKNWKQVNHIIDKTLALEPELRIQFLEDTFAEFPDLLKEAKDYLFFIEKAETTNFLADNFLSKSVLVYEISSQIQAKNPIERSSENEFARLNLKAFWERGL